MNTNIRILSCIYILNSHLKNGFFLERGICIDDSNNKLCCHHFFRSENDNCEECPSGFTSNDGVNCTVCIEPYYGRRCASKCNCSAKEKCNPVDGGCKKVFATMNILGHVTDDVLQFLNTTNSTVSLSTFTVPDSTKTKNIGFNVVYYIAIAGILIFVIFLCLLLNHVRKMYTRCINRKEKADPTQESQYGAPNHTSEYQYIPESEVVDHVNENSSVAGVNIGNIDTDKVKPNGKHVSHENNPRNNYQNLDKETKAQRDSNVDPYLEMKPPRDNSANPYIEMKTPNDNYSNTYQLNKSAVDIHQQSSCGLSDETYSNA